MKLLVILWAPTTIGDGQPNQQALAIDAVDFSASLTDQHTAAISFSWIPNVDL